MDPILDPLNKNQKIAVTHESGPLLVFAGAGSGKTRTITHRIAYLIREKNIQPYRILGVTFTNKAAGEMKERANKLVGESGIQPELRTFHSFGVRLLSGEIEHLDREKNFTIYDDIDQRVILKETIKELMIDPDRYNVRTLAGQISSAKDSLLDATQYSQKKSFKNSQKDNEFVQIYSLYEKKLKENNAYDFGDLLMVPVKLLQANQAVRKRWQERYQHIMVDEFQDTNPAQFELARLLSEKHRNIVVVGDDDQSIYSWRGADISNILNFEEYFPEAKTVRLEQNYRSTQPILDLAHKVISKNTRRQEKQLWTQQKTGKQPEVYGARNDYGEAEFVLNTIRLLEKMQNISPGDCAVFFRVNAQSRVFEEVFTRENMPYVLISSVGFYERKEIKDLLAYLKLLANPSDNNALKRIINRPTRGIGQKTESCLFEYAAEQEIGGIEALAKIVDSDLISSRAAGALNNFYNLYLKLRETINQPPVEIIETVLQQTGYIETIVEKEDRYTAESRMENIEELKRVAADYGEESANPNLIDFVEEITLLTDLDTQETEQSAVNFMTLHAAKGLEFDVVFMVGMEEGLLPHRNSEFDPERREEERRLCYVGFTRARERLYCCWSRSRRLYGNHQQNLPSPFLKEADLLGNNKPISSTPKREKIRSSKKLLGGFKRRSTRPTKKPPKIELNAGDRVKHPKFGQGTVKRVDRQNSSPIALIEFKKFGEKRLAIAYAELDKIN